MLFETSAGIDVVPTFDAMRLKEDLLRGIYNYGGWVGGRRWRAVWATTPTHPLSHLLLLVAVAHGPLCAGGGCMGGCMRGGFVLVLCVGRWTSPFAVVAVCACASTELHHKWMYAWVWVVIACGRWAGVWMGGGGG